MKVLCAVAAGVLAAGVAMVAVPAHASSQPPFQAYNLSGDASCLRVTVNVTGYSYYLEPDAELPRSTVKLGITSSSALASPADPGDSVDTAAGLLIAEGNTATGSAPAPLNQAGQTLVSNPADPIVTYPIEHASASYPDPSKPGSDSNETLAGSPDLHVADPTGIISADANPAIASAGPYAVSATAGLGGGEGLPMAGISVGQASSSAVANVGQTSATETSTCSISNLIIAPPGQKPLDIGSLAASVTTTQGLSGAASATHSISFGHVTVGGQAASIGPKGLTTPAGAPLPWPSAGALPPLSLPGIGSLPATQVALTGERATSKAGAGGNEQTASLTGATITLRTGAPLPNTVPPTALNSAPATITINLADLSSSTYALPPAATPTSAGVTGGGGPSTFSGAGSGSTGGGSYTTTTTVGGGVTGGSGPVSPGPAAGGRAGQGASSSRLVTADIAPPLPPGAIAALGAMAEILLLAGLLMARRWHMRGGLAGGRPAQPAGTDLA